jgi:glycerophosphoryl diester phosphodiesterase
VDTLELDVGVTKDGWVVVSHDQALNPDITRGPDGKYLEGKAGPAIKDLTYVELQQYDVGRIKPGTSTPSATPTSRPSTARASPRSWR